MPVTRTGSQAPLAITLEGLPIVLYRPTTGSVAALEDRCAHRNAPLSMGTVCKAGLRCSYHGWVWGPNGNLEDMPSLPTGEEQLADCRVRHYPACEQEGFVWISLHPSVP